MGRGHEGSGHDHGHSYAPVTQEVAKTNATKIVATLVKKAIVDKSWSTIAADSVEKKWVFGWEKVQFKKKKNPDLWIRFLKIYRKHNVVFHWIKGHANIPENERCDRLAVEASKMPVLQVDINYEKSENELF